MGWFLVLTIFAPLAACGPDEAPLPHAPVEGIYQRAPDVSVLWPCADPSTQWWVATDSRFVALYDSIAGAHGFAPGDPGPWVYVRAEGVTRPVEAGREGYVRTFVPDKVHEMNRVVVGGTLGYERLVADACAAVR